jgi:hypothetical protein
MTQGYVGLHSWPAQWVPCQNENPVLGYGQAVLGG